MRDTLGRREVAILGYGCRLPGAENPEAFWRLLEDGRCAIGRIPDDRWDSSAFLSAERGAPGSSVMLPAVQTVRSATSCGKRSCKRW